MKISVTKINLLLPFIVGFAVWCGIEDKVSWWTLAVIFIADLKLNAHFGD